MSSSSVRPEDSTFLCVVRLDIRSRYFHNVKGNGSSSGVTGPSSFEERDRWHRVPISGSLMNVMCSNNRSCPFLRVRPRKLVVCTSASQTFRRTSHVVVAAVCTAAANPAAAK